MSSSGTNKNDPPRRLVRAEAVLAARRRGFTIVLEDTHDPHNVSAVLRSCEAFGIQDVHLVFETEPVADLNPKVSIGAERWLTVYRHESAEKAIASLRAADYRLFVSHLDVGATELTQLPPDTRAAYVFGNEQSGVTPIWLEAADNTFVVPTSGFTGSLNLSVAVALTLYDRLLGRPGARVAPGDLSTVEKAELRRLWYEKLARGNPDRKREYEEHLTNPTAPRHIFAVDRRRSDSGDE